MSRKNKESLTFQVQKVLKEKLAIGQSKHADKNLQRKTGEKITQDKIYSWETYHSYIKHANYFAKWCKENYNSKTIEQCRSHVDEWLAIRSDTCSAYTVKLEAAALAKLYGCSTTDFIKTKSRNRCDITRSRGDKSMDRHFSKTNNAALIDFCRSTGLRRSELELLTGDKLRQDESGNYYIIVDRGSKGGKYREVPVIGNIENVVNLMENAGKGKVFSKIHSNADIHSYRAEYATAIYKMYARPLDSLPKREKYYCRNDKKGIVYDKVAMLKASQCLGHNRISVIGEHYLRCI